MDTLFCSLELLKICVQDHKVIAVANQKRQFSPIGTDPATCHHFLHTMQGNIHQKWGKYAALSNAYLAWNIEERYEQAEPLLQQSLALSERHTGYESPATANRMSNLALLYSGQERYAKAEPLFKKAFAINKRCLGAWHPETARTMENLAFLYLKQGASGEPNRSCTGRCAFMPNIRAGKARIPPIRSMDGQRYGAYKSSYIHSLKIREKVLGWESPTLLKTRQIYSAMLQSMDEAQGQNFLVAFT